MSKIHLNQSIIGLLKEKKKVRKKKLKNPKGLTDHSQTVIDVYENS